MSFATSALRTLILALLAGLSLPLAAQTQAPHRGTPFVVPAQGAVIIEAEDFDDGGEGVAYHDNVLGNAGGQYRTGPGDNVDIISTNPPGGFVVNNFDTGEWLEYTISVQAAGQYEIAVLASSSWTTNTPRFHIEIDNRDVTGSVAAQLTANWTTFQWNAKGGISLPAGVHVLKLVSDAQYFNVDKIRVTATPTTPFAGVIPIPGPFEAENYDIGGPGISYSDTTPLNDGGQFRTDGVDIIASRDPDDAGTGFAVNGFHAGEWMVYTVEVQTDGLYDIEARVATGTFANAAFHIEIDGVNVTGSMMPGATGGFGTYQWVKKPSVSLSAGRHVLKLVSDQEIADVNRIKVSRVTHTPYSGTPVNGTPIALPGTFEAEHFDEGGEGNAYHDTDTTNDGGAQFRVNEGVDIKPSPDSAGGTNVINNFKNGEYLVYTVNVAESRDYDIWLRAATGATTSARYHIQIDSDVKASVALPATGSFGTYDWIGRQTVHLTAGQHTLKLFSDQQFFDVNQIRVVEPTTQGNHPDLLFRSGYEGDTQIGPIRDCNSTRCNADITGFDSTTGFTWPPNLFGGPNSDYRFDLRPGTVDGTNGTFPKPSSTDPNYIGNYMFNEIRDGEGRNGSRALKNTIIRNGCCGPNPQTVGNTYDTYIFYPPVDVPQLYISYWVKFPADFVSKLHGGEQWRALWEWKTPGDFRVILNITGFNDTTPIWDLKADGDTQIDPATKKVKLFWRVQNTSVPVPVDRWFKFQVFWRRSTGADSRVWVAIDEHVIFDQRGVRTIGDFQRPIDRLFLQQMYTGGAIPAVQWIDDLQIWKTFPTAVEGNPWWDPPYAPHAP